MPTNKDWGPFLWTFLHGAAERLGKQTNEMMASDEAREVTLVIRGLELVMPCEKCRAHFHEYLKKNPVDDFHQKRGEHLRQSVRLWLWKLHETVNDRNGAPSFPLENLTPQYASVDIASSLSTFFGVVTKTVANGNLVADHVKSFRRHVSFLRSLIGI